MAGREPVSQVAMGEDGEALLLFGAIHVGRDDEPCQCTNSAESVSLNRSTVAATPSATGSPAGTWPLYPMVLMVWSLAISTSAGPMRNVTSAGPLGATASPFRRCDCSRSAEGQSPWRSRKGNRGGYAHNSRGLTCGASGSYPIRESRVPLTLGHLGLASSRCCNRAGGTFWRRTFGIARSLPSVLDP